jgi:hypothetical protein
MWFGRWAMRYPKSSIANDCRWETLRLMMRGRAMRDTLDILHNAVIDLV